MTSQDQGAPSGGPSGGRSRTADDLLGAARARLAPRLSPSEVRVAQEAGALVVDIRPAEQRRADGEIPGAVVVDRNVMEWRLDPASRWRIPEVRSRDQPVVVVCNEGYQSSLAAAALVDLGFRSATDLEGGFGAWRAAGLPVDEAVPDLVGLLDELQAIGRAGLHWTDSDFDRERYQRLLDLAVQGYASVGPVTEEVLRARFEREVGCITPKVGADAVLVDAEGRVLLVERADDQCWGLVSGWVEPNEHPAATVVREAREEVGLDIEVEHLVGVFSRRAGASTGPHSLVSVVYRARIVGGEPRAAALHEVLQVRWWPVDDVPAWHHDHETFARAALAGR